jgi:hypothetical protein
MTSFWRFFKEEQGAKKLWNSRIIGIPLWLTGAFFTVYWLFSVPPPGYSVGALAVVAGVMSVRDVKIPGKIIWVFLLVCLLITEFRAIDKDRAENQKVQKEFYETQKNGFGKIVNQATDNFNETAKSLSTTINGLKTTMKISTQTLKQTYPHALLSFIGIASTRAHDGVPRPLTETDATTIPINIIYQNVGNDTAKHLKMLVQLYAAKLDDAEAQKDMAKSFEAMWKTTKIDRPDQEQSINPTIWTITVSIDPAGLKDIHANTKTVYYIIRASYSDSSGDWQSDNCGALQNPNIEDSIIHSCKQFPNRPRYHIRPQ